MGPKRMHAIGVVILVLFSLTASTTASPPAPAVLDPGSGAASRRDVETALAPLPVSTVTASQVGDVQINEVCFAPAAGSHEWIELKNAGSDPVKISGYGLTDEDGHWYRIPDALPALPGGALVVIALDGLGSEHDEYDLDDGVATLHSPPGLVDVLEDDADQVALYTTSMRLHLPLLHSHSSTPAGAAHPASGIAFSSPVAAFVAWGTAPGDEARWAAASGAWAQEWAVSLATGLGLDSPAAAPPLGTSIGLLPNRQTRYADDWALYQAGEASPGAENGTPALSWFYPANGATVAGETFALSWNAVPGATGYRFQLDDGGDLGSPLVDTILDAPTYAPATHVSQGTYYWRAKALLDGSESAWSPALEVHAVPLPATSRRSDVHSLAHQVLDVPWQGQHKDTQMVCLDGDPETGPGAWDTAHASPGTHGSNYCVRASISMLAAYYGGQLSQDRISYHIFGGGPPEGDLGHNRGVLQSGITEVVSWALGVHVPAQSGKPTFVQIQSWIDDERPVLALIPGHIRVIDGYLEALRPGEDPWQFVHLLDPWNQAQWVLYADDPITSVWVGPPGTGGAPGVRSDEDLDEDGIPDTVDDSDGDGLCDFDERNRFAGLSLADSDSDDDLVPDKLDVRGYVFDAAGSYRRRSPDIDRDGDRKEVDLDNDNGGAADGCEDANQNGKLDSGETSNFDPAAEASCVAVEITAPATGRVDEDCLLSMQGLITTTTDLTSLDAQFVAGGRSKSLALVPIGTPPQLSFSCQTPLFVGENQILVTARSRLSSASDSITAICSSDCPPEHTLLNSMNVFAHSFRAGPTYIQSGRATWIRMSIGFNNYQEAVNDHPNIGLTVTMNGVPLAMDGTTVVEYNDAAGFWEVNSYHCTGSLPAGSYTIIGTSYRRGQYVDSARFELIAR